jgi:quinol monooxygenase YgiN
MLALAVRFDLRPGAEADFDRLVETTTARIRAEEPGTLLYLCHRVREEPTARVFYELYRDHARAGPQTERRGSRAGGDGKLPGLGIHDRR